MKFFTLSSWFNVPSSNLQQVDSPDKSDCIILTGGEDISPSIYGQDFNGTHYPNKKRDIEELSLIGFAKVWNIPIVGICRGMQLLHASNGGSLIQDLPGHGYNKHQMFSLKSPEKPEADVNSVHHQGVPIGEAITMYGEENVYVNDDWVSVEAMFCPARKTYGVQYHPEFSSCPQSGREFFIRKLKQFVGEK